MAEHERIWLEPAPGADQDHGRQWAQQDVWADGVEYLRADLCATADVAQVATMWTLAVSGRPPAYGVQEAIAVEAMVTSLCDPFPSESLGRSGDVDDWRRIMRKAYRAALDASPKACRLEWTETHSRNAPFHGEEVVRIWESRAIGFRFGTVVECTDGLFTLLSEPTIDRYPSLEEAQTVAQSDFESRISSAFVPSFFQGFAG